MVAQWAERPRWLSPGRLWVLDPRGEPVLAYAERVQARDVLDDVNQLLRMNPQQ